MRTEPITASVGLASPDGERGAADVLADADLTMHAVKDVGGDGLAVWVPPDAAPA